MPSTNARASSSESSGDPAIPAAHTMSTRRQAHSRSPSLEPVRRPFPSASTAHGGGGAVRALDSGISERHRSVSRVFHILASWLVRDRTVRTFVRCRARWAARRVGWNLPHGLGSRARRPRSRRASALHEDPAQPPEDGELPDPQRDVDRQHQVRILRGYRPEQVVVRFSRQGVLGDDGHQQGGREPSSRPWPLYRSPPARGGMQRSAPGAPISGAPRLVLPRRIKILGRVPGAARPRR